MIPSTQKRHLILSVVSLSLGIAVPIIVLEIVLRLLPVMSSLGTMTVNEQNPIMRFTPNQWFTYSQGWRLSMVNTGRINNYGFVNQMDYRPDTNQKPVVIIGDSYVEALMVPYEKTVQGRLDRLLEKDGHVYSLGISGAQLPQYLAFAEYAWRQFDPKVMVFVIVGNDFDESMVKYRDWPGFHYFTEDSLSHDLKIMRKDYSPSVAKRVIRHSAFIRYLWGNIGLPHLVTFLRGLFESEDAYVGNTASAATAERVADSKKAVNQFLSELSRRVAIDQSKIVFVVDAMRPEIYSDEAFAKADGSYFGLMRRYFLEAAKKNGYEAIDMQPLFKSRHLQDGTRFEFPTDHHWNEMGHREAAYAVLTSKAVRSIQSSKSSEGSVPRS